LLIWGEEGAPLLSSAKENGETPAGNLIKRRAIESIISLHFLSLSLHHNRPNEIRLCPIVCLPIVVKTIGELPFERLILPGSVGMGPQVVAEGKEVHVFLPVVLDDVKMMRVGDAFSKGVTRHPGQ
jgi:hypothetical protein